MRRRPVSGALDDFETRVFLRLVEARDSGTRVTTRSLAGEFGVGVSKMHTALERLADEGLCARQPPGALRALVRQTPIVRR